MPSSASHPATAASAPVIKTIASVARRMADLGISQMPIRTSDACDPMIIISKIDMVEFLAARS